MMIVKKIEIDHQTFNIKSIVVNQTNKRIQ
jgi:hypothetical protein